MSPTPNNSKASFDLDTLEDAIATADIDDTERTSLYDALDKELEASGESEDFVLSTELRNRFRALFGQQREHFKNERLASEARVKLYDAEADAPLEATAEEEVEAKDNIDGLRAGKARLYQEFMTSQAQGDKAREAAHEAGKGQDIEAIMRDLGQNPPAKKAA